MAVCTNTHRTSSKVQGPGPTCNAFAAWKLAHPGTPYLGANVCYTNSGGKCVCYVVANSTSKSHPGRLVFKRTTGGTNCPSTSSGCCSLLS